MYFILDKMCNYNIPCLGLPQGNEDTGQQGSTNNQGRGNEPDTNQGNTEGNQGKAGMKGLRFVVYLTCHSRIFIKPKKYQVVVQTVTNKIIHSENHIFENIFRTHS